MASSKPNLALLVLQRVLRCDDEKIVEGLDEWDRVMAAAIDNEAAVNDAESRLDEQEKMTPIGKDEPVFLIRAKDRVGPCAVRAWAFWLGCHPGADKEIVEHVSRWADRMDAWQEANGNKLPDTPHECLKR